MTKRPLLRPGLLSAVALLLVALAGCRESAARARPLAFVPVAEGVEYARFLGALAGDGTTFQGHAFRIDLEHAGLRVLPAGGPTVRREVSVITRALPQAVAVNGSFFDEKDRAMGLVVDQGRVISKRRLKSWGALIVEGREARIVKGSQLDVERPPGLVVQGMPRLVVDGRVPKLKPQAARRTAVCAEGRFVTLVMVTSSVDATSFARFLARPQKEGGLGCENALNLDGGPSTQMSARLVELSVEVPGGWGVPNAIVALPGLPEPPPVPPRQRAPSAGDAGVLADAATRP